VHVRFGILVDLLAAHAGEPVAGSGLAVSTAERLIADQVNDLAAHVRYAVDAVCPHYRVAVGPAG